MTKLNENNTPPSANLIDTNLEGLYNSISSYLYQAKQTVLRSVNTEMLNVYWHIGREIVEEEQKGAKRAEYGQAILRQLSQRLTKEFGKGYGVSTLKDIRQFYLTYSENDSKISHALRG